MGTSYAAIFNFALPQGPTGADGYIGRDGSSGPTGPTGYNVANSLTAPSGTHSPGDMWWKTDDGRLKIYYTDPSGDSWWVDAGGGAGGYPVDAYFYSITVTGTTDIQQVTETLNTKTGASGIVTHDYSTGAVFFHTSIAANFTCYLTNVPTTANKALAVTLILSQGGTGYIPNALYINGVSQTIRWVSNTTPTPSTSKIDVVTFSMFYTSSTWYVLGQLTQYA